MTDRVTIKSIARDLGISHMTVSRALSNHPNVLKETRERVQKRARELGYIKSAAAKAMRGGDTRIVGLLLPNIINEFYARFANTLALACEKESLQLIIHLTGDDVQAEAEALDRLREVQARGVVMVPAPGNSLYDADKLRALNVIHLIRHVDLGAPVPSILIDDSDAIGQAVAFHAANGNHNIAYIGADRALSSGLSRLTAFCDGMSAAGLEPQTELLKTAAPSSAAGHDLMRELLDAGTATAVVCGGVEMSNGALQALLGSGHALDRPIAFVGYGDATMYSWVGKGVTTIDLPVKELAEAAATTLSKDLHSHTGSSITFPARLICR